MGRLRQPSVAIVVAPAGRAQVEKPAHDRELEVHGLVGTAGSQAPLDVRRQGAVVHLVDGQMADGRHDALQVIRIADDGCLVLVLYQVVRCDLTEEPYSPPAVHLYSTELLEAPDQPAFRLFKTCEAALAKSSVAVPLVDLPGSVFSGVDPGCLSAHS